MKVNSVVVLNFVEDISCLVVDLECKGIIYFFSF